MDFQKACDILKLTKYNLSQKNIKKAYYRESLLWHPDRNNGSTERFQKISLAYAYLIDSLNNGYIKNVKMSDKETIQPSYIDLLSNFVSSMAGIQIKSDKLKDFLNNMKKGYHALTIETCKELNKNEALSLYSYLERFSSVLGMDDSILKSIEEIVKDKIENDELIILRPTLDNILKNDVYSMEYEDEKYFIPLWHHELEFDLEDKSLIVKIVPELPENIRIDDDGSLHISMCQDIKKLFNKDKLSVSIGEKTVEINTRDLSLKQYQTIRLTGKGITQIDTKNIFSIDLLGDLYIHLEIICK